MFKGTFTALITPMRAGQLDIAALRELVEFQISEGIDGLVPCGTTGETPTLSRAEQATVIRTVVEVTKGRVPVIAGAGANATPAAIEQSKAAAELGVDALLHVTPYYNKPPQRGLISHFKAIADAVELPIILYNVPGRTGCDLLPASIAELAEHPRIVAIKEATGSIPRGQEVIATCAEREIGVLSGDDGTCLALTLLGGDGVISVVSNAAPRMCAEVIRHARAAELPEARALHYALLPLIDLLFLEANPIPIKAVMAELGFGANELRAPLVPVSAELHARLVAQLQRLGLRR